MTYLWKILFPFLIQLEGVAQDCIDILAETGDFVSPDRVFRLLLDRFQVRNLRDLQVPGIQFPYQIECINQHERMLCKVTTKSVISQIFFSC